MSIQSLGVRPGGLRSLQPRRVYLCVERKVVAGGRGHGCSIQGRRRWGAASELLSFSINQVEGTVLDKNESGEVMPYKWRRARQRGSEVKETCGGKAGQEKSYA